MYNKFKELWIIVYCIRQNARKVIDIWLTLTFRLRLINWIMKLNPLNVARNSDVYDPNLQIEFRWEGRFKLLARVTKPLDQLTGAAARIGPTTKHLISETEHFSVEIPLLDQYMPALIFSRPPTLRQKVEHLQITAARDRLSLYSQRSSVRCSLAEGASERAGLTWHGLLPQISQIASLQLSVWRPR